MDTLDGVYLLGGPLVPRPKNEAGRVALALAREFGLDAALGVAERQLARKPGRPPGSVRKPQAGQVGVRLTVEEREWLRARAKAERTTEAGLIRRWIAERMR